MRITNEGLGHRRRCGFVQTTRPSLAVAQPRPRDTAHAPGGRRRSSTRFYCRAAAFSGGKTGRARAENPVACACATHAACCAHAQDDPGEERSRSTAS